MIVKLRRVLLILMLVVFQRSVTGAEKTYDLTVSATAPKGQALNSGPMTGIFSEKINCRKSFKTKVVKNRNWRAIPSGAKAESHVNLMMLRFGNRLEFLAFMFEKPGEAISYVARAPALEGQIVKYFFAASPGDYQVPQNAPTDLIANFANGIKKKDETLETVGIEIKAWTDSDAIDSDELNTDVGNVPSESDLSKLTPLACAAVFEAGFKPSLGKCDTMLTLEFRRLADGFDIQGTLKNKGKTISMTHRGSQNVNLYYDLIIISYNLLYWQGALSDFARVSDSRFTPLTVYQFKEENDEKAYVIGTRPGKPAMLQAFTSNTSTPAWENGRVPIANLDVSRSILYLYQKDSISRFDLKTGTPSVAAPIGTLSPTEFDSLGNAYSTVQENRLAYAVAGSKTWEKTLKTTTSAGPVICNDVIIVSLVDGTCVGFSRADGSEKWRKKVKPMLKGQLTSVANLCLGSSVAGKLVAINPADGAIAWSVASGDVLVQAPLTIDGKILAISKANKFLAINPSDGKILREKSWPTWILKTLYLKESKTIVCIDLKNQVSILDWADFKVKKQYKIPFKLQPLILTSPKFPSSWNSKGELLTESCPAWLFFDQKGFMYIFNSKKISK